MTSLFRAAFVLALLASPAARAADEAVMALPTTSLTFTIEYVAEDQGFFAERGLKVTSRVIAGVGTANAVLGGDVEFGQLTASVFARAAAHNQRMLAIANLLDRPMQEMVLRKDIAEAAHWDPKAPLAERARILKGKTIAVDGILTNIHAFARLIAVRGGLDPEKDIQVAPMSPPSMPAALDTKSVDAFTSSLPWTNQAVAAGKAVTLASSPRGDLPEFLPFAYLIVVTRPDYCPAHKSVCGKLVKGFLAAAAFIHEHPQEVLAIVKKRFPQTSDAVLRDSIGTISQATPKLPVVTVEELRHSETFNVDAGVMKKDEMLSSFDGLFTDEFLH
jgi:NitT/TauT family transport system substrate-binding protein